MAPEAIDTPREVTVAADVWSLGAMMWHLMTGVPPYGIGLRAVNAILTGDIQPPPAFLTANAQFAPLAKEIIALALSCLKRDPGDRPTADDLVTSCGQLCYTPSLRRVGIVRRFPYPSYGFIATEGHDVFFHMESVYGSDRPGIGDRVVFSCYDGGGAPRAHPVMKLKPHI